MSKTSRTNALPFALLATASLAYAAGLRSGRHSPQPIEPDLDRGGPRPEFAQEELAAAEPGRGREAESPREIPTKGWKDILLRTRKEFLDDQAPLVAAGVTFFSLFALFPGVGAFVSLWGLFGDVGEAQKDLQRLATILPGGAISVISDHMANVAATQKGGLSLAAFGGLLLSIWSANGAMKAVIAGVGLAYDEPEERGFIRKTLTSLGFTLGFLVFALIVASVLVGHAAIETRMGHGPALMFSLASWPVLFLLLCAGLALLYRYGPSRQRAKWRWLTWGSVAAATLWLVSSIGFSLYAANFGNFDKTYGALGGVIGFLTWIWISSMVILLGAELNSEIEHQTAEDSTDGPAQPLGQRGAAMADTVGSAQVRR